MEGCRRYSFNYKKNWCNDVCWFFHNPTLCTYIFQGKPQVSLDIFETTFSIKTLLYGERIIHFLVNAICKNLKSWFVCVLFSWKKKNPIRYFGLFTCLCVWLLRVRIFSSWGGQNEYARRFFLPASLMHGHGAGCHLDWWLKPHMRSEVQYQMSIFVHEKNTPRIMN